MSRNKSKFTLSQFTQVLIFIVLHFILLVVPLYFRFVTEEIFEFNKLVLMYCASITLITTWIIRMLVQKNVGWKNSPIHFAVALFLLSQFLATVFSLDIRTSLYGYYGRFHGGLFSLITYATLYIVVVHVVARKHLTTFLHTAMLSASLVSMFAILEHFGYSLSCFILSDGTAFDTACWVQDVQARVFASFGQPNWLAAYLITLLPVSVVVATQLEKNTYLKTAYIINSTLMTAALLFTGSRSGFLGFLISAAWLVAGICYKHFRQKTSILRKGTVATLLTLVISLGGVIALFGSPFSPPLFSHKVATTPSITAQSNAPAPDRLTIGGTESGEIRKIVWQGAFEIWRRYPLFGSGVETFAYSYYLDRPVSHNIVSEWDYLYNKAHNEFLNVLATTGATGLISYCILLGYVLFRAINFMRRKAVTSAVENAQLLTLGITAGIIAQTVSNFFGFSTVMVTTLLYFYFACLVILDSFDNSSKNQLVPSSISSSTTESASNGHVSKFRITAIILVALCGLFGVLAVYRYWLADVAYARAVALEKSGDVIESFDQLQVALSIQPNEPLYYDELSNILATIAIELARENSATEAAEITKSAITASDIALALNPHHLNFYKSRSRVFITLSQLNPEYLQNASEALDVAISKAPTDAKLYYNRAKIEQSIGKTDRALLLLQKAVELKPNYIDARFELGKMYQDSGNIEGARLEYLFILEKLTPDNEPVRKQLELLNTSPPDDK